MACKTRTELVEAVKKFCEENNLNIHYRAEIKPGDLYIGYKNIGPELLTCRKVSPHGWIIPVERAYFYNIDECIKVTRQ